MVAAAVAATIGNWQGILRIFPVIVGCSEFCTGAHLVAVQLGGCLKLLADTCGGNTNPWMSLVE